MSLKTVTLTRKQVERLAVYLQLNANVTDVTIEETSESGIGLSHWVVFHNQTTNESFQAEITDVGNW